MAGSSFLPDLSKSRPRIPACFYSAVDKAQRRAVLVLEDINQDTVQGDVLVPLNMVQAKGVARNLALLHATCGIAQWEPSLPRAIEMIEAGIEHENRLVAFWQKRDSELFSFLNPSNKG